MRGIYRSATGHDRLRGWCEDQLSRWSVVHDRATVATSLGETHLLSAGAGRTIVVYFPGTNFNAATSLSLLGELASRSRVMAVDLPGQPGLSAPGRPTDEGLESYGRWAGEVLDVARQEPAVDKVILAGHSMGAAVALSAPPKAADAVVLLSPAGLVKVRLSMAVLRTALPWMMRPSPARARALLAQMTGPETSPSANHINWLTMVAAETRTSGAPGPLPDAVTRHWREVPRLVLTGEHDCFFPPARLATAARTRLETEVVVLDRLGHLTVDEDPIVVAERVVALAHSA